MATSATDVEADDFFVVAQVEEAVGEGRGLAGEAEDLLAADFFVGLGRGADDDEFAGHVC